METICPRHIPANSESTQIKSKIPEYAKDYKKEWLCMRWINKTCGEFIKRLDFGGDLFNSPQANRLKKYIRQILRAEELGNIKDISSFRIKFIDVDNLITFFHKMNYDEFVDDNTNSYPGYREFYECFSKCINKINIEFPEKNESDSESEIDINVLINS